MLYAGGVGAVKVMMYGVLDPPPEPPEPDGEYDPDPLPPEPPEPDDEYEPEPLPPEL